MENESTVCVDEPNDPYILIDTMNKIFELCYLSCDACTGKGNSTQHKCSKCKSSYYLQPDTGSSNCEQTCPSSDYIKDNTERKCINCASLSPPQFRYNDDTSCTLSSKPTNTYYINQQFNILGECYSSCVLPVLQWALPPIIYATLV